MKKTGLITLLLSCLTLTSCTFINILTTSQSSTTSSTSEKESEIIESTYENLIKNSVYEESVIPTSVKNSKYLVIPVWFTDSDKLTNGESKESIREKISLAFTGTSEETGWHSVKTFYEEESKGNKTLDFTIADWYNSSFRSERVVGLQESKEIGKNTEKVISDAVDDYFSNNPMDNRKNYDSDGDGYLDAIAIIYAIPDYQSDFNFKSYYGKSGNEITNLWAYVYWFQNTSYQNVNKPGQNAYLWASYDFAYVSSKNPADTPMKVDAHAYIHETGHLFGLDDYYDYTGDGRPAGGFSMQDRNIGGHDPFSVISLGWGDIHVPEQSETFELSPFQSSNQVILLSNHYENSVFDEYFLLEYYTPTGLNELDTLYKYESKDPQGVNQYGIRLWHVDARLAYLTSYSSDYKVSQISNKIDTQYFYNMLCRNNTYVDGGDDAFFSPLAGYYNFKYYRLLELVRANVYDTRDRHYRSFFEENSLFVEGDSFDMVTYRNAFIERGKLNSGKTLGWSFKVESIAPEKATISIVKS